MITGTGRNPVFLLFVNALDIILNLQVFRIDVQNQEQRFLSAPLVIILILFYHAQVQDLTDDPQVTLLELLKCMKLGSNCNRSIEFGDICRLFQKYEQCRRESDPRRKCSGS
jgi:hypothetical protein